ncbi:hypothetical protein Srubr_33620 [Streptomyces rubradiris]|uniref:HTH cro/C1-type domain-containing protein n=1 Tax=Streptomyces rubradiris TaxID=285531 RepID=A0ABQ3RCE5_STRRR|nr:hypothetical protein GCM10018792_02540 [Streptomyces rubradiris]GHI53516.1 hypothetical protein Srubr_33620 [Streptomyces rubradiris]
MDVSTDSVGKLDPQGVSDAAALVQLLRELKQRSGLTLRELEERARARGELLARSTVSDMLRGIRLPAPGTVAAFVRACGAHETDVDAWLEARQRAEEAASARPSGPAPDPDPDIVAGARRTRSRVTALRLGGLTRRARSWVLVGELTTCLVAVAVWALSAVLGAAPPSPAVPPDVNTAARDSLRGFAEIRPARTPQLCLTEGRDTQGAYLNAVAAQLPCEEARPPHTYLRPVEPSAATTSYFIEWQHPQHGWGCLTVRREGPGKDLLEPWPSRSCDAHRAYQHFRIEPAATTDGRYRLRLEGTQRCVGLRGDSTEKGADAMVEPCGKAADQEFLIRSAA